MKTKQNHHVVLAMRGHVSSNQYIDRAQAERIFEIHVETWNLIAFEPDPSGYRYAHNEDLTIRCWIQKNTIQ